MNKGIIFGPPYDELEWNKWERPVGDKLVLRLPSPEAKNLFKVWEVGFLFYRDTHWYSNFKDDGQEYYIYEETDVDDDDDFYGGEFMIGDTWEGD